MQTTTAPSGGFKYSPKVTPPTDSQTSATMLVPAAVKSDKVTRCLRTPWAEGVASGRPPHVRPGDDSGA
jgi:hypothetical protein